MVGQSGRLGRTRRAAGELNVDGVVELDLARKSGEPLSARGIAVLSDLVEAQHAGRVLLAEADDDSQLRSTLRAQGSGRRRVKLREQIPQHVDIVAALERGRYDEGATADAVERELELGAPIRGVDVDQDQSGSGGRELRDDPLGVIRRPHTDAFTRLETETDQARGEALDVPVQLAIAPTHALVRDHQRVTVGDPLHRFVENGTHREAEQRPSVAPVYIARRRHSASWDVRRSSARQYPRHYTAELM